MDFIFPKGENSREILINGWKFLPYIIPIYLIGMYFMIPKGQIYNVIKGAFTDPFVIFTMLQFIGTIFIGYYYPVSKQVWLFMTLSLFMMVLAIIYRYIH